MKRHTCFAGIFFADVLKYEDNILTFSYKLCPDINWERNLRGRGKLSHHNKYNLSFFLRFYTSACNGTLCIMHHEKMTSSKRRAPPWSSPCPVLGGPRALFPTTLFPKQTTGCIEKEPFKARISCSPLMKQAHFPDSFGVQKQHRENVHSI